MARLRTRSLSIEYAMTLPRLRRQREGWCSPDQGRGNRIGTICPPPPPRPIAVAPTITFIPSRRGDVKVNDPLSFPRSPNDLASPARVNDRFDASDHSPAMANCPTDARPPTSATPDQWARQSDWNNFFPAHHQGRLPSLLPSLSFHPVGATARSTTRSLSSEYLMTLPRPSGQIPTLFPPNTQ